MCHHLAVRVHRVFVVGQPCTYRMTSDTSQKSRIILDLAGPFHVQIATYNADVKQWREIDGFWPKSWYDYV